MAGVTERVVRKEVMKMLATFCMNVSVSRLGHRATALRDVTIREPGQGAADCFLQLYVNLQRSQHEQFNVERREVWER